ncbi:MAG TPA: NAD(FAD)-dependent dehydrogenase [Thermoplasmatales archaeon]|nr:NAD(FAD)-dependent dehydrogenase [Thermoplasmatales archaeon]
MNVIVIGGGAAGATAAQFARKHHRTADITVFEQGPYPQYSKCALPWVIAGDLAPEAVIEFSEEWFAKARIDLCLGTPVREIDLDNRTVSTGGQWYSYDALVLATGASPSSPVPPAGNTFFLRTLDDARAIAAAARNGGRAIIIGAGLIGLETAEALHRRGLEVTVLEFLPEALLTMLDRDMAEVARSRMPDIHFHFQYRVTDIAAREDMVVTAVDGEGAPVSFEGDLVIVATGNRPNIDLAPSLADRAIVVDERCQTRREDVYAVGDCTRYRDRLGNDVVVGLGSIAVRQAMVAGENAVGGEAVMPPLLNARTTRLFGTEIAAVGPVSDTLPFRPVVGKFTGSTLPEYMPGEEVTVKVLADREGNLVGAQAVGPGAAQRINKFALAIHAGLDLNSFLGTETAYAPPVAPVIDVSSVACDMARRRIR